MLARGLARRCPVCGQGRLFRRWFTMLERCPRCGFRFERREGQFVGAVGINTVVSFGALMIVLIVGVVLSLPDLAVAPVLVACVITAVVVPVFFYPVSKTLWDAIDLAMSPLEPGEAPGIEQPQRPVERGRRRPGPRGRPPRVGSNGSEPGV